MQKVKNHCSAPITALNTVAKLMVQFTVDSVLKLRKHDTCQPHNCCNPALRCSTLQWSAQAACPGGITKDTRL